MRTLFALFALLSISTISAGESNQHNALYLINGLNDDGGLAYKYEEPVKGHFNVWHDLHYNNGRVGSHIDLTFDGPSDHWHVRLGVPGKNSLKPGIYENAKRFSDKDSPGIDVSGNGRGNNENIGSFEILEIEFDDKGKINVLAVDFIQKACLCCHPLLGSIRYNSSIPLGKNFHPFFKVVNKSTLHLKKYSPNLDCCSCCGHCHENQDETVITEGGGTFSVYDLPHKGRVDGAEIVVEFDEKFWILDFSAPKYRKDFTVGNYDDAELYPLQEDFQPGIRFISTHDGQINGNGKFKVMQLVRDEKGNIQALAINFIIETKEEEIITGALRYNSEIKIDSDDLYNCDISNLLPNLKIPECQPKKSETEADGYWD